MSKISDIEKQALLVRDATEEGENTAFRVGTAIYDLIKALISILPGDISNDASFDITATPNNIVITHKGINSNAEEITRQTVISEASLTSAGLLSAENFQALKNIIIFLDGINFINPLKSSLDEVNRQITENTSAITTLKTKNRIIGFNAKNGIDINTLDIGNYTLHAKGLVTSDPKYPIGEVATLMVVQIRKSSSATTQTKGAFLFGYCAIGSDNKIIPSVTFRIYQYDGVTWGPISSNSGSGGLSVTSVGNGWWDISQDGVVTLTIQDKDKFTLFEEALNLRLADKIDITKIGRPNGVCPLDADAKIPNSNLHPLENGVINLYSMGEKLDGTTLILIPPFGSRYDPDTKKIVLRRLDMPDVISDPKLNTIYINNPTAKQYCWVGNDMKLLLPLGDTPTTAYPGDKGKKNAENIVKIETNISKNIVDITGLKTNVNALKANSTTSIVSVSNDEHKVGIYDLDNAKYDLWEKTLSVVLINVGGDVVDYVISDEPLGAEMYIDVTAFVVKTNGSFICSKYEIESIRVDNSLNTIIGIACKAPIAGATAIITLQYIKLYTERVDFTVTNIGNVAPADISLSFPKLKYCKKFAYTFTIDDCDVGAYSKLFCAINKKWIDDEQFYHVGQPKSTGRTPTKTLGFTDGLGIDRRFNIGVACWFDMGKMDNPNPTKYWPWLVYGDVPTFVDYGNELYFHDVNKNIYDETSPTSISKGLSDCETIALNDLNMGIKILCRPNGNNVYISAGKENSNIVFMASENTEINNYQFDAMPNLTKGIQFRRNLGSISSMPDRIAPLTIARNANVYKWLHDFDHRPPTMLIDYLTTVNDTFGKDGDDSIWFASMDEIWEYWFISKYAKIRKLQIDGGVKFSIMIPKIQYGKHVDFTIQLHGLNYTNQIVTPISNNVYGLAIGNVDAIMTMNINTMKHLLDMAEKYTANWERTKLLEDKEDAIYFVNQLRSDLSTPFRTRLSVGEVAPILNSISINNDAVSTYNRNVNVSINATGEYTHYRIAEVDNLDGIAWISGNTSIAFILSTAYGAKTVYVQIKNAYGQSAIRSDTINFISTPVVAHTVSASSNNTIFGSVTPLSQVVADGGTAEVNAEAKNGYEIESWIGANSSTGVGSSSGIATLTNILADKVVICNFRQKSSGTGLKATLSIGYETVDEGIDNTCYVTRIRALAASRDLIGVDGKKLGQIIVITKAEDIDISGVVRNITDTEHGAITGNDSGRYPDKYLAHYFFTWSNKVNNRIIISLTIPAGSYKIRIFASINKMESLSPNPIYKVGDMSQTPNFILNNTKQWMEFDAISNGTTPIEVSSSPNAIYKAAPINLIEIVAV